MVAPDSFVRVIDCLALYHKDPSMRRTSKTKNHANRMPCLVSYRPVVESLEERLPPGDVLLGGSLMGAWLGRNESVPRADALGAVNSQGGSWFAYDRMLQARNSVAAETRSSGSALVTHQVGTRRRMSERTLQPTWRPVKIKPFPNADRRIATCQG